MSLESLAWAIHNRHTPSPTAKLVLIVMADHLDVENCSFKAVGTICEESGLDRKAVIRALDMLEEAGLIEDTGRRIGQTGRVKLYRLLLPKVPKAVPLKRGRAVEAPKPAETPSGDQAAERVPDAAPLNCPQTVPQRSRKRYSDPRDPDPSPPEDAIASSHPPGGAGRGSMINQAWTPPPTAELPPKARGVAEQWPAGSYAAEAEAFRSEALSQGGRRGARRDWNSAWAAHVVRIGAKPLRDAKAGLRLAGTAPSAQAPAVAPVDRSGEGAVEGRLRDALQRRLDLHAYGTWVAPSRLEVTGMLLTVIAPSPFIADWMQRELGGEISDAARQVVGAGAGVRWRVEAAQAA